MRRAAIYARFSSDLQRDRSIEDQVALCREYAQRNDLSVVQVFEDRARSGSSVIGRDGIMRLMDGARGRVFDAVVVEALDRLSRDQEDLAGIYKRLSFVNIAILAVHDGVADQIQVGIRGLVGALYLQDLAHKVRRGMAGVVRDGRHPGGRAYGYRPVPGRPGELEVVEAEAAIVKRIFEQYTAGTSARDIAAALNEAKVPPPRGRFWSTVTIHGHKQRGNGILANHLYVGEIAWNRVRMVKDPDTGKRVSRVNPTSDWQFSKAPHLRIVDEDVYRQAQTMKANRSRVLVQRRRRPKHLLSGLLRCSVCGGGMSAKDRDHGRPRIVCTASHNTGAGENRRPYYLDAIERSVVEGLRERLADRATIEIYLEEYNAEAKRLAMDSAGARAKLEAKIATAECERERTLQGYLKGFVTEADAAKSLPALKDEIEKLTAELACVEGPANVLSLHPTAVTAYLNAIDDVRAMIAAGSSEGSEESKVALRDLIDTVTIFPPERGIGVTIEVVGNLTSLIGGDHFPTKTVRGVGVVAEEGLEPPTRGL